MTCLPCKLLLQWASTIKIWLNVLFLYKVDIISLNVNLFSPWYIWKIAHLVLNNNQKLIYYTEYIPVCYLLVIYSLFCYSKLSTVCWHTICLISLDHYYGKGGMFAPMVYMSVFVSIWFSKMCALCCIVYGKENDFKDLWTHLIIWVNITCIIL